MLAATLALLICSSGVIILGDRVAHAAEVECREKYTEPSPEDLARTLWPSGFRPTVGMCERGFLHGTIVKGDYEKVAALYRANHKLLTFFSLQSPGGDATEAMKIGRLFRRYLISVEAPLYHVFSIARCSSNEECLCASACALIWFGAVERLGQVGLHRPRTADPRFKAMAPSDASVAYKRMLAEISRYLEEMEAPRAAIDAMVATSSSEIRWWGASGAANERERTPSIAEWTDASCGSFTENEFETMINLEVKKSAGLMPNEQMLLQFLTQKDTATTKCEFALFHRHVDRLPPPDVVEINPFEDLIPEHK